MLALVDRVLTDPAGEAPLTALEDRLRGAPVDWHALVHDNKRRVADGILRSEVLRIGRELRVALADAPADTEDAVAELLACFPVYRSYLPAGREHLERGAGRPRGRTAPTWPRPSTCSRRCSATPRPPPRCASSRPAAW